MDAVVLICALILNPIAKRRRKRLAENLASDGELPIEVGGVRDGSLLQEDATKKEPGGLPDASPREHERERTPA